jgi:D-threo-aldose 1-dehydrogenase
MRPRQPDLPRLGFGAAALGNLYTPVSDETAQAAVDAALAAGLDYFDTAPHYGFGLSESRLGDLLPRSAQISTKVGRRLEPVDAPADAVRHGFAGAAPFEPVFDYSYDGVMAAFEASLARLGRQRVDVLLAHDLGRMTHGDAHSAQLKAFLEGGYRAMVELRKAGLVGAIGLGVNEWQVCLEAAAHADFDVFLLAGRYTLLEQSALDSFLPTCAAKGVSVIVGGPFNSGILVEDATAGSPLHYNYEPAPKEIVERVVRLRAVCRDHDVALPAAALRFPLAHPAVISVIPGLASATQVRQALGWLDAPIPPAFWRDLRQAGLLHADAPVPEDARPA